MTRTTATVEAGATRRPFNADLREVRRNSVADEAGFPLRLADFGDRIEVSRRSNRDWAQAHDRAIGVLIGIALTGAAWAAWAIVATQ